MYGGYTVGRCGEGGYGMETSLDDAFLSQLRYLEDNFVVW